MTHAARHHTLAATACCACTLVVAALLSGCSVQMLSSNSGATPGAAISGTAHGGNFPVENAVVRLWYPGVTAYGAASNLLASTTTNSSGSFGFASGSYTCPASDMPVYLTVTGGNPGLGSTVNWTSSSGNSYVALMASLGPCSGASSLTGIVVNEVTTVATALAVGQFSSASQAANGLSSVNTYTVTAGGTGYTASTSYPVTFSGGGCSTEPAASILSTALGALPLGTFNTATPGVACTSAPSVAVPGGTGAIATAAFSAVGQSGSVGGTVIGSISGTTASNGGNIGAPIGTITAGALTVTDPLAYTAIKNAFNNVTNLVNIVGGWPGSIYSNATFPTTKLGTMADILATCVQSDGVTADGSQCSAMASTSTGVTPVGHTLPSDTVQMALYMALSPFTNVSTVFSDYATAQPVYPAMSTAPFDWTMPVSFSNIGLSSTTNIPWTDASDANGNIWITTNGTATGLMAGVSPLGQDLYGAGVPAVAAGSTVYNSQGMMIDGSNNVWLGNRGSNLVEFNTSNSAITTYTEPTNSSTACGAGMLAFDDDMDIGLSCSNSPYPFNGFLNTGTISAPAFTSGGGSTFNAPASTTGTVYTHGMASDANGAFYTSLDANPCGITQLTPNTNPVFAAPSTYTSTNYTVPSGDGNADFNIAVDHNNTVWFACTNDLEHLTYGGSSPAYAVETGYVSAPKYIGMDGAGDIWVPSGTAFSVTAGSAANAGSYYSVSEFNNAGTALTPKSSTSNPGGIPIFYTASGSGAYPLPVGTVLYAIVDASGDVWLPNDNAGNSTGGGTVVELIGAAVPTFAPLGIAASQNRIGTLP